MDITYNVQIKKKKLESVTFETTYKILLGKLYTKYTANMRVNNANDKKI